MVDFYNSVFLSYGVLVGIEDFDKIEGDFYLGFVKGGEGFFLLGVEEDDLVCEGEVIYYDNGGVVCCLFNWWEVEWIMLIEIMINGVVVMEFVNVE